MSRWGGVVGRVGGGMNGMEVGGERVEVDVGREGGEGFVEMVEEVKVVKGGEIERV